MERRPRVLAVALYVAWFDADGTGEWLELTFGLNNITPANLAGTLGRSFDPEGLVRRSPGRGARVLWRNPLPGR